MKKILIVGMPFSVHTRRWMEALVELPLELHFFSSFPYAESHLKLNNIIYHDFSDNFKNRNVHTITPIDNRLLNIKSTVLLKYLGKIKRKLNISKEYSQYLADTIAKIRPDIIHTLETQHAGYLMSNAFQKINFKTFVWIHSTWGIDLHYFLNMDNHRDKIMAVFNSIDIYVAEGTRDVNLARSIQYRDRIEIFPSVGGYFEISPSDRSTSERDIILVKGYNNELRKGINALKALENVNLANKFKIVIYGCDPSLLKYINNSHLKNAIIIKNDMAHLEMIELTKQSIISITINLSDGLPNSFIEAMACGAFPIQSNTSMANEWIEHGVTGMLVNPLNINEISEAITYSLKNKKIIDAAALINRNKFENGFNKVVTLNKMKSLYFNNQPA